MAASGMPREGTLLSESSASKLEESISRLERTVFRVTKAIDGLATRVYKLTEKFDDVFDPETSIVKRAALLSSIDKKIAELQSLAGIPPAAPADDPSAERP